VYQYLHARLAVAKEANQLDDAFTVGAVNSILV
jgi:hypothetical protein